MISMIRSWAAAFKMAPVRKAKPAVSMLALRPRKRVMNDAKNVATRAARYREDVKSCKPWLSYLQ